MKFLYKIKVEDEEKKKDRCTVQTFYRTSLHYKNNILERNSNSFTNIENIFKNIASNDFLVSSLGIFFKKFRGFIIIFKR